VRLVSEEITPDEADNPVSLLDNQAIAQYQDAQAFEEQQVARTAVKDTFAQYLNEKIGPEAADWLKLYLQGHSQEVIAQKLQRPIKEVYRLREKISYHAIRVFALKSHSDLVANWLETSLQEHSLGLTPNQWQHFISTLSPKERQVFDKLRAGESIDAIAGELNLKTNQVMGEWSKLYLAAQELRAAS
jgi:hypothetical protein